MILLEMGLTLKFVQWSSVGRNVSPLRAFSGERSFVLSSLMDREALTLLFDGCASFLLLVDDLGLR